MKKTKVYINGTFIDSARAKVSIFDRGFLYGDGVFETMRAYAGTVFKLDEHLKRLVRSLATIGIAAPYSVARLAAIVTASMTVNKLENAYIRLAVTRGEGRFGIGHQDRLVPNIVVIAKEFEEYPSWMHKKGVSVELVAMRQNEYSPLPRIKSLNYLNYIVARLHAKSDGFDEALLVNTKGYVAEGATSNVFLVKRHVLVTPSLETGILPGITRATIISLAKRMQLAVRERLVDARELPAADEVFLTNSLAEVLPVTSVGGKKVGTGLPGDVTKLLHISYQKEVIRTALFGEKFRARTARLF